ncbi:MULTISPECIES: hypothetical protein [Microbacterium]|uniref:hypothetical protein n=1 Tax=Microbacterium TaxID=33882 RepID=UPI001F109375|nr:MULTISPECIES: hypothetical protein [Microbacterium]
MSEPLPPEPHPPADAEAAEAAVQPATTPDLTGVDAALGSPPPLPPAPTVEAPSPDVVAAPVAPRIPGAARTGYTQLPTAPVILATHGPVEGESSPWSPPPPARRAAVAAWALALAIVALGASFFVGWMLPFGLAGFVVAIVALRRPRESRAMAVWALVLSLVSIAYSAGWLLWVIPQLPLD